MNCVRVEARHMIFTGAMLVSAALFACGAGDGAVASADDFAAAVTPAGSNATAPLPERRSALSGLDGTLIVGYQGWFGCPEDFEGNTQWQHWFYEDASPRGMRFDALPSVRGLDPQDLCDTGIARLSGGTIQVFSSQRPGVVMTHFRWMKEHGIDGAAVQRFVLELPVAAKLRRTDNVLSNVRLAAEANGRVFYISYDVSGAAAHTVVDSIRKDWARVVSELNVTASSAYLRDAGKPVVQLWGFGFTDRPGEASEVASLIADLKNGAAGLPAATVVGGVPSHWRSLTGDSKVDPAWAGVYRAYDVLSPWSVGRFADDAGADAFVKAIVEPDIAEARRVGVRYQPVVFPGFSWRNLMVNRNPPLAGVLNAIPRRCGNLMWRQVRNLINARADMLYAAMFDEVDEGTALFPLESHAANLPVGAQMIYLNQDGCTLAEDWYLQITGQAASFVHRGIVPPASLTEALAR